MTGNLYLARQKAASLPDVVQKLQDLEADAFRAADMIQQLLTFARRGRINMATLSLNAMLRDSLRFLHATVPENIVLKQKVTDKRLFIRGDGTQLHQVLLNLISNACDALEQTPSPQITIHLDQCDGNNILAIRSGENRNRIYA